MRGLATALAVALLLACGGGRPASAPPALSPTDVAAALQSSGLPVTAVVVASAASDPDRRLGKAGQYVAKVTWQDTRVLARPPRGAAAVELFADGASLRRRADELNGAARTSPALLQYHLYSQERNALLRLPIDLTAEQANLYRAWFEAL